MHGSSGPNFWKWQEDTAAKNLSQFVHIGCFIVGAAQFVFFWCPEVKMCHEDSVFWTLFEKERVTPQKRRQLLFFFFFMTNFFSFSANKKGIGQYRIHHENKMYIVLGYPPCQSPPRLLHVK